MLMQFNNIPKIALIGQMGAGKDYLAAFLDYEGVALSDPIKMIIKMIRAGYSGIAQTILKSAIGFERAHALVKSIEALPIEGLKDRPALQLCGETVNEFSKELFWVHNAADRAWRFPYAIITDVRREEEFEYFKARGFLMIGIDRPEESRIKAVMERDKQSREEVLLQMKNKSEEDIEGLLRRCPIVFWNAQKSMITVQQSFINLLFEVNKKGRI